MKTYSLKPADIKRDWVVLDATGVPIGRLAAEAAKLLRGKNKPYFAPHLDCGDHVVIINQIHQKRNIHCAIMFPTNHHPKYWMNNLHSQETASGSANALEIYTTAMWKLPNNKIASLLIT